MSVVVARAVRKWVRNTSRGKDNYQEGIAETNVNPMELAAANYTKMKSKLMEFLESNKWPEIMRSIPVAVWKDLATKLGPDRFARGVETKAFKVQTFWTKWGPLLESHRSAVLSVSPDTWEGRKERMIRNVEGLKNLKGKWRSA